jgi:hypothetical protein
MEAVVNLSNCLRFWYLFVYTPQVTRCEYTCNRGQTNWKNSNPFPQSTLEAGCHVPRMNNKSVIYTAPGHVH